MKNFGFWRSSGICQLRKLERFASIIDATSVQIRRLCWLQLQQNRNKYTLLFGCFRLPELYIDIIGGENQHAAKYHQAIDWLVI